MRVMVIAAHPDDEVLGVGGTVLRHTRQGDSVDVVIVGDGATARGSDDKALAALHGCATEVAALLGTSPPIMLRFPDNRLDSVDLLDVVQAIEALIEEHRPEVLYTHSSGDLNVDHRIVHEAVRTASRPLPESTVQTIYAFETVSSTEWGAIPFAPNHFVDIGHVLEDKLRALACHETEMRPAPHARSLLSVESLARVRGSSVGVAAAEAFEVVMQVLRGPAVSRLPGDSKLAIHAPARTEGDLPVRDA